MYTSRAITILLNALRRVESELLMADVIFDIDALISPMTDEEAAEIYKATTRRAPNFAAYQVLMNAKSFGQRFHVDIPKGTEDAEAAARDLRYNLNEAAKERKALVPVELTEDEQGQLAANKRIAKFEREDGDVLTKNGKGEWVHEVPQPAVLRWKVDTRDEEREVTEGEGDAKQTVKKTVKVPTRMHMVVTDPSTIQKRARRNGPVTVVQESDAARAEHANGQVTENAPDPATAGVPAA